MKESSNFTDIGNMYLSENALVSQQSLSKKKGWFVTYKKAVVLAVLVLVACGIVGVAVYFAHPDKGKTEPVTQEATIKPPLPPPTTTTTSPIENADVRLPGDIVPVHYDVRLRPDIYSADPNDFNFNGTVNMIFTVQQTTKMIVLHWRLLEIDMNSVRVMELPAMREVRVDKSSIRKIPSPLEFLEIPTNENLVNGGSYQIHMAYAGRLKKDLKGIYYSDYIAEDGNTVYLLTSQLQATDSRKTFPCMDEPALKATFNVTLERRDTKHTKSNTRITHNEVLYDGWVADHYEPTPKMSTYLLAFLVSDFECVQNYTSSGKLVEVCARPPAFNQTEFAMSIAIDMQNWFEEYHAIAYPLPKTTHVALPDFSAGAMENWGLIMYRETALLYDPQTASVANKQRVAVVVSHELAHMWFGNLVTPEWWDDVWLNEGFASYMELWGIHYVKNFNTWKMEEQFVVEDLQRIMVDDSLITSHPIYLTVNDPLEIGELFDGITYSKGASVIRMMKYFLGESTFRWGLSNYLKDRQYQAAGHRDLFNFLTLKSEEDGGNINVSAVMNTWILQMGYPVVTFDYEFGTNQIGISQQHYLLDPTLNVTQASPYGYKWMVPISYMTDQSGIPDLDSLSLQWLNGEKDTINNVPTNLKWVIGNVGQTFFYRVNYDENNWKALAEQLLTDHSVIPTTNRAQILDDAFKLGRSGYVDQSLAFDLTKYMSSEMEYTPWYAIRSNIRYTSRMLYQTAGKSLLENYMQNKLQAIYGNLGWTEDVNTDSHLDQRLRSIILSLACGYSLDACLVKANETFNIWMQALLRNETYMLSPNFASTIYCYGIYEGGIKQWEFAYHVFLKSNSGAQKNVLLSALSCSKESWVLQRYLQWALAEDEFGIGQQDMRLVLNSVASNPIGTHIAWNFFKYNWEVFFERFGSVTFTLASMVQGMTSMFSTEWELSDLQRFVNEHPNLGTGERAFQQAIESTKANLKWRNDNEENIISWLENQSNT